MIVCEVSESLLPNNSRPHDLSHAIEIPSKAQVDKLILKR
jgi:hypothetical protein